MPSKLAEKYSLKKIKKLALGGESGEGESLGGENEVLQNKSVNLSGDYRYTKNIVFPNNTITDEQKSQYLQNKFGMSKSDADNSVAQMKNKSGNGFQTANIDNSNSSAFGTTNYKSGLDYLQNSTQQGGGAILNSNSQATPTDPKYNMASGYGKYQNQQSLATGIDSAADTGIKNIPGFGQYYGYAKDAEGIGKSSISRDSAGNAKGDGNAALDQEMTSAHEQSIQDFTKGNTGYGLLDLFSGGSGKAMAGLMAQIAGKNSKFGKESEKYLHSTDNPYVKSTMTYNPQTGLYDTTGYSTYDKYRSGNYFSGGTIGDRAATDAEMQQKKQNALDKKRNDANTWNSILGTVTSMMSPNNMSSMMGMFGGSGGEGGGMGGSSGGGMSAMPAEKDGGNIPMSNLGKNISKRAYGGVPQKTNWNNRENGQILVNEDNSNFGENPSTFSTLFNSGFMGNAASSGIQAGNMFSSSGGGGEALSDGGEIRGKGTPKSDSIKAKVEPDSFIVPEEYSHIAKKLAKDVLGKKVGKEDKANLKQKSGEDVWLSNKEYMFTPEEKQKLIEKDINIYKLAPQANQSLSERVFTPEERFELTKAGIDVDELAPHANRGINWELINKGTQNPYIKFAR